MSPESRRLPIGVVIPTRNCRTSVPRHLEAMKEWLPRAEQIVVVDSRSDDGTVDEIRARLGGLPAVFLDRPPGLYPAWNAGIARIRARYTYISTMGDAAPTATLEGLAAVAESTGADAVVSPPVFVDARQRPRRGSWPIHRWLGRPRREADSDPCRASMIPGWEWFAWAVCEFPGTLLGSSASNLYRTEFLARHPFPEEFGHSGDSAWAIRHAFQARFAAAPGLRSTFWVHPGDEEALPDFAERMNALLSLAEGVLAEHPRGPGGDVAAWIGDLEALIRLRRRAYARWTQEDSWPLRWLVPSPWRRRWALWRLDRRLDPLRSRVRSGLARLAPEPESGA